mmetsp:Transcript_113356/g.179139  ORF Transcript_113356/g.179139 Transcript_113356/m.179139 type:complete len:88 (-) Transcript_113356:2-265(-)
MMPVRKLVTDENDFPSNITKQSIRLDSGSSRHAVRYATQIQNTNVLISPGLLNLARISAVPKMTANTILRALVNFPNCPMENQTDIL